MTAARKYTLQEQRDLVADILTRSTMLDGTLAGESWIKLSAEDLAALQALGNTLVVMCPHEDAIRNLLLKSRGRND